MKALCRWLPLLLPLLLPVHAQEPAADATAAPAAPITARYRILHAAPRHGALTIFADGAESVSSLVYAGLSPYEALPAGVHSFSVSEGDDAVVAASDATLEAGRDYTIAVLRHERGLRFVQIRDREPALPGDDDGRVRATNLATAHEVAFSVDERPLAALLAPGQSTPAIAARLGDRTYRFTDTAPGGAVLTVGPAAVPDRTTYSLYLIGMPGAEDEARLQVVEDLAAWPADVPLPVPVASVTHPRVTRLRVIHLAGGTGVLDGELDGKPLFGNLAFGDVTAYLPQAPGIHRFELAGAPQLDHEPLDLWPDEAHTLVICGEPNRLRWWLLHDGDGEVGRPALRIVHAAWQAPSLVVSRVDGDPLAEALGYFDSTRYRAVGDLVMGQRIEVALRPEGQSTVVQAARLMLAPDGLYTLFLADSGTAETRAVRLKLLRDGGA